MKKNKFSLRHFKAAYTKGIEEILNGIQALTKERQLYWCSTSHRQHIKLEDGFNNWREKKCLLWILFSLKSFKSKGKVKTFSEKTKTKPKITNRVCNQQIDTKGNSEPCTLNQEKVILDEKSAVWEWMKGNN